MHNNRHIHHAEKGDGQILICTAGEGWYQEEGKEAISLTPGTVIMIPAEVKRWHGAETVRIIKNREDRRNRYLLSLKCLFCYAEKCVENRKGLQKYLKYLLTVTSLNLGTIRIHHTYIRDFLKFLEESLKNITDIEIAFIKEYFDRLAMQNIKAQSYNNKLQAADR